MSGYSDYRFERFCDEYLTSSRLVKFKNRLSEVGVLNEQLSLDSLKLDTASVGWGTEEELRSLFDRSVGVCDGFRDPLVFDWCFAPFYWESEQKSQFYEKAFEEVKWSLDPHDVVIRERAEDALRSWRLADTAFERSQRLKDAASDLELLAGHYSCDYLGHMELAVIFWLWGKWDHAKEHFELAARNSGATNVEATVEQKYYAAVAYSHLSLILRIDAAVNLDRAYYSLNNAKNAASIAFELYPIPCALIERVLTLLINGKGEEAAEVACAAIKNESNLLILESVPEIWERDEVRNVICQWRDGVAAIGEEVFRIGQEIKEFIPSWNGDLIEPKNLRGLNKPLTTLRRTIEALMKVVLGAIDFLEDRKLPEDPELIEVPPPQTQISLPLDRDCAFCDKNARVNELRRILSALSPLYSDVLRLGLEQK